jgi:hypothetical protein
MFAAHVGPLGLDEGGHGLQIVSVVGLVRRVVSRGRQALCGLRGHEMVRHFEPARLSLRCVACGAETPGWTIDVRPAFRSGGPARAKVHAPSHSLRNIAEESARAANNFAARRSRSPHEVPFPQRKDDPSAGPICAPLTAIGVTPLG